MTEIFTTEQTYVKSMELCLSCYLAPLLNKASEVGEDPERIKSLFGNMSIIVGFNTKLLTEVEEVTLY